MTKKVAIIGAAASGLPAIKSCLDEGLEPVCFERTAHVGGLWYFTPEVHKDQACVMRSTVINTSKEMMTYSDFPIPQEFPVFMHNTKVLEYLKMYGEHFGLLKHVRFNTEIQHVRPSPDFDSSGKWTMDIKDNKTGETTTEEFDAVLVCTGHHAEKYEPHFEGEEEFEGEIVHPHDYKDHRGYEDKRVVVIGIGNSGGDVSVELGRVCSQVFLSTRRGAWVLNRVADGGMPLDFLVIRRVSQFLRGWLPRSVHNYVQERRMNSRLDHVVYGLQPAHPVNAQHPTVNDDLPNRIACGSVLVKPNVKRLTKRGVEFEDGSFEDNIDVIIKATGYIFGFPFLDKSVIEVKNNVVNLYKYVFPPDLSQGTLAVIGCIQPVGAIMPLSEMQCRWATQVFNGTRKLPSKEFMWKDIRRKQTEMQERYCQSLRHTIQVDWIPYMDELAEHAGCRPDIGRLFLKDPKLALTLFFGPCTPYQFRLMGPNKWAGAKEAIYGQWDRTTLPTKTRVLEGHQKTKSSNLFLAQIFVIVLLACLIYWLFLG